MPKKTSETETVETMNMELSTPGTAEDTAVSMTENENSEIALGSSEEIVENLMKRCPLRLKRPKRILHQTTASKTLIQYHPPQLKPKKPQTFLRRLKTGRKTQPQSRLYRKRPNQSPRGPEEALPSLSLNRLYR